MAYKSVKYVRGTARGIYTSKRRRDKVVALKHNLPGSIILVHGVNDVGTGYAAAEAGLCAGLTARLAGDLRPAGYSNPSEKEVMEDPDAALYKRQPTKDTHSPVIPFYWGYREEKKFVQPGTSTPHGQALDRYGNRLDKDFSKGGGPFANATSSLPEMWNRGKSDAGGSLDYFQADATHPVLDCPGRLYMILAARRLAALITMIRDFHKDETVSIVAHSQGCMLSLLAQAFLLDEKMREQQPNARPADTLILCNPPYSLVDEVPNTVRIVDGYAGSDAAMKDQYALLDGSKTLNSRLTTLVNIVEGIHQHKHASPALSELPKTAKHCGVVGGKWVAQNDRDNRGKVYLYFSPEDMTVALSNVQGIGWQGVPDFVRGWQYAKIPSKKAYGRGQYIKSPDVMGLTKCMRKPIEELGSGFFQRVFTIKKRPDFDNGDPVLIGQKNPPHYFSLRGVGEDDQDHTEASDSWLSRHAVRARLPEQGEGPEEGSKEEQERFNVRKITGEALPKAVVASMFEGALTDAQGRAGASELVDPIDAAIAVTSAHNKKAMHSQVLPDPTGKAHACARKKIGDVPIHKLSIGRVVMANELCAEVTQALNRDKSNEQKCKVIQVFVSIENTHVARPTEPPMLYILRTETTLEARLRWQKTRVPRSFHGAIYSGSQNHRNVTAYDVAIGGGKAPTHPLFYQYLCAVADWRLKEPVRSEELRPGILGWTQFKTKFKVYWGDESAWRKALIHGNVIYYSTGALPDCLPLPRNGLPPAVFIEKTKLGKVDLK